MLKHIWNERNDIPEDVKEYLQRTINLFDGFLYMPAPDIFQHSKSILSFYSSEETKNPQYTINVTEFFGWNFAKMNVYKDNKLFGFLWANDSEGTKAKIINKLEITGDFPFENYSGEHA